MIHSINIDSKEYGAYLSFEHQSAGRGQYKVTMKASMYAFNGASMKFTYITNDSMFFDSLRDMSRNEQPYDTDKVLFERFFAEFESDLEEWVDGLVEQSKDEENE
jgi:hypothetical protein